MVITSSGGVEIQMMKTKQHQRRRRQHHVLPAVAVAALSFASTCATSASSSKTNIGRNGKVYRRHHPSFTAPTRPTHFPDIEYSSHPFDAHRHLYDINSMHMKNNTRSSGNKQQRKLQSSSSTSTTVLDPTTDANYQPLRIQFDTSELSQQMELALSAYDYLAATKLYLLMYEILPMTASVWGDILRVIPVQGGIYPLAAKGSGKDQVLDNEDSSSSNNNGNEQEEMEYYDDPVRAMYCPDETTSGIAGGADLLVYATVNRQCASSGTTTSGEGGEDDGGGGFMGTLASALSCQRDQYDRPITGSIDFCLEGMRNVVEMNVEEYIASKESAGIIIGSDHMVGSEIYPTEKWNGWNGVTATNADGQDYLGGNRREVQYSVGVAMHGK